MKPWAWWSSCAQGYERRSSGRKVSGMLWKDRVEMVCEPFESFQTWRILEKGHIFVLKERQICHQTHIFVYGVENIRSVGGDVDDTVLQCFRRFTQARLLCLSSSSFHFTDRKWYQLYGLSIFWVYAQYRWFIDHEIRRGVICATLGPVVGWVKD
jgi:hypothetical protein